MSGFVEKDGALDISRPNRLQTRKEACPQKLLVSENCI